MSDEQPNSNPGGAERTKKQDIDSKEAANIIHKNPYQLNHRHPFGEETEMRHIYGPSVGIPVARRSAREKPLPRQSLIQTKQSYMKDESMIHRYFKQFLAVALMLMAVVLASQSLHAQCVWPPSGMVSWWPLDETSGPTANDIAPHGFNNAGIWISNPTYVAGKVGGALSFNGSDYVSVPDHLELNFGIGDFSIDLWIRTTQSSGVHTFLDKRMGPDPKIAGYALFVADGYLGSQIGDGAGYNNWVSTGFVADGNWHHITVTVDRNIPSGWLHYIDGGFVGPAGNPMGWQGSMSNPSPLVMGQDLIETSHTFVGALDEIELFNRVLDTAEIRSIWAADSLGKCKVPYGSIFGHKFEDIDDNKAISGIDIARQGWPIELYKAGASMPIDVTVTNASGLYSFPIYQNGTYYIREIISASQKAAGWAQILPATVQGTVVVTNAGGYQGTDFLNDSCETTVGETSQIYLAGSRDGFAGAQPSSPSLEFSTWLDNSVPSGISVLKEFDAPAHDDYFGHTFVFSSNSLVVDATLCVHLKGTSFLAKSDWLSLGDWGGWGSGAVWNIGLNDLQNYHTGGADIEWNNFDTMTVCLDLDELIPGGSGPANILAELQDGDLDIFIGDDTEVDWLELTVTYCCDSCDVDSLDVSTGIDPKLGWLGILKRDPEWVVGATPVPGLTGPVALVNPYPGWLGPQPSSVWATANPNMANGLAAPTAAGDYAFQYCFCADTADHPRLDITVRSDNLANIYLNKTWLKATSTASFGSPPTQVVAPPPSAFFQGGNVITALVHNDGVVVGLDVDGYIKANYHSLLPAECCSCYTDGDINGNGTPLEVADLVYLIRFLRNEETPPIPLYLADVNGDCEVDSLDAQTYTNYFTQGLSAFPEYPVRTCCCVTASLLKYPPKSGDANGDGAINISDAVYLIAYIFAGGPAPDPVGGDANCDAAVNISDAVYLIAYIFAGGPPPCEGGFEKAESTTEQAILSLIAGSSEDTSGSAMNVGAYASTEIAGVQLEFRGDIGNLADITVKTTERSKDLMLFSGIVDGLLRVGLIDMTGKNAIAAGDGPILSINSKGDRRNLELENAVVCERNGHSLIVKIEQAGKQTTLPLQYGLAQNYPNPFNPSTEIHYALAKCCDVRLEVLNVLGQKVKTLANGLQVAGIHSVTWDGTDDDGNCVSSGVYFYRIISDAFTASKKMLLLK